MSDPILTTRDLDITYANGIRAVRGVSIELRPGEILGLVGESGSGKSTIGYAILGHLSGGRVTNGSIQYRGADLTALSRKEWGTLRGRKLGMVYQEPQSALNPAYTIGEQIAEGLRHHGGLSRNEARSTTIGWLDRVKLPNPTAMFDRYPHQMSGGQLQRAVIAMAFALEPEIIVMDEPTTGLDVTTQAHILDLIAELRTSTSVALLYVSHDLAVVGDLCDRVMVLHRGRMVEEGQAARILANPRHPYTQRLVASIPSLMVRQTVPGSGGAEKPPIDEGCSFRTRCTAAITECASSQGAAITVDAAGAVRCWRSEVIQPVRPLPLAVNGAPRQRAPLFEARSLTKRYGAPVIACDAVSLRIGKGECVALIGESGSGKTSMAKCVLGLEKPTSGELSLGDLPLPGALRDRSLSLRQQLQIVFQNPDGSLNPRRTIGEILERPLVLRGYKSDAPARARSLLQDVDLPADYLRRYPHELSGGEKQRVAIARALACEPKLIVCDEPVSALDVSVQGTVIDLFRRLQAERGLSYLFITHDLGVVRQLADTAIVLFRGQVCHVGDVDSLLAEDAHPYVKELIASLPGRRQFHQAASQADAKSAGCSYFARCHCRRSGTCDVTRPPLLDDGNGTAVACFVPASQRTTEAPVDRILAQA